MKDLVYSFMRKRGKKMYVLMMSLMCAASAAAWMWAENNGMRL